jgi:hypothetical protein
MADRPVLPNPNANPFLEDDEALFNAAEITDEQDEFLNFLEQYWFEFGLIPTSERAKEMGVPDHYYDFFKSANFRAACRERGISLRGLEIIGRGTHAEWKRYMLSEQQLTVANVLLDLTDTRSAKKKLADLGIPTQTYQSWLRDPGFQNYIRARAENALGDNQHEAHLALIDRVRSGDMGAIKYYNELTGRYVPASQGGNAMDAMMIVMRVLEIIQQRVQNPELQSVIATDLMKLAEPGALPSGPTNQVVQKQVHVITSAPEPVKNEVVVDDL